MSFPPPVIPPPVTPVGAPAPPPERNPPRDYLGWIVIAVVGALLISLQFTNYLTSSRSPTGAPQTGGEASMRLSLLMFEFLQRSAPKGQAESSRGSHNKQLKDVRADMAKKAAGSDDAAFLAIVASEESKQPIPQSALDRLEASERDAVRELAAAFREPKLARAQAEAAAKPFATASFSRQLAAAHLLERAGDKGARSRVVRVQDAYGIIGLFVVMGGVVVVGLGCLIAGAAFGLDGRWKTLGKSLVPTRAADADRYALRFAAFLLGFVIVPSLVTLVLSRLFPGPLVMPLAFGSAGLVFWAFLGVRVGGVADSLKGIIGDFSRWKQHVAIGLGAYAANFPVMFVLAALVTLVSAPLRDVLPEPSHPVNQMMAGGNILTLVAIFITAAILAPIIEELTFRGTLYPALARFMPAFSAMLLQGFLFAAIHPQGPLGWPMLMAIGVMGAFITHKQGSLLPAIVMHAAHNATILAVGLSVV